MTTTRFVGSVVQRAVCSLQLVRQGRLVILGLLALSLHLRWLYCAQACEGWACRVSPLTSQGFQVVCRVKSVDL